jgi:hypothetical protein
MVLRLSTGDEPLRWELRDLPARPMIRRELNAEGMSAYALAGAVEAIVGEVPRDAVLSIRVAGELTGEQWRVISSARLRALVPATMNVEVAPDARYTNLGSGERTVRYASAAGTADTSSSGSPQMEIF